MTSKTAARLLPAILSLVITVTSLVSFPAEASAKSKWEGYTPISSAEDLLKMNQSSDKFYLTKDVDLKKYGEWKEAIRFSGTLDGNGYCIQNLTSKSFGLFHTLTDATVKNLGLVNVNIRADKNSVGALTNGCKNSVIENCYVTGSVQSESGHAGGLVGFDSGAAKGKNTLTNCVNMASVTAKKYSAYGIIKSASDDTLANCCNYGKITGTNAAGGICDRVGTEMVSCYSTGKVTATEKPEGAGGIACYVSASLKDCATAAPSFTVSMSANCKASADTNVAQKGFKKAERYAGYDFGETWTIHKKINNGMPVLTIMLKNYNKSCPTVNKPSGTYKKAVSVSLSTDLKNGEIRYTTNGSAPTVNSPRVSGSLTVKKNTTIKAAVFVNGIRAKVLTLTYVIE